MRELYACDVGKLRRDFRELHWVVVDKDGARQSQIQLLGDLANLTGFRAVTSHDADKRLLADRRPLRNKWRHCDFLIVPTDSGDECPTSLKSREECLI